MNIYFNIIHSFTLILVIPSLKSLFLIERISPTKEDLIFNMSQSSKAPLVKDYLFY